MITNFEDEKQCNWKDQPALQQFCSAVNWEDEQGNPFNQSTKQAWLAIMNDNQRSDMAAITYRPESDYVELWYTNYSPFTEKGIWAVIPGISRYIEALERDRKNAENEIP